MYKTFASFFIVTFKLPVLFGQIFYMFSSQFVLFCVSIRKNFIIMKKKQEAKINKWETFRIVSSRVTELTGFKTKVLIFKKEKHISRKCFKFLNNYFIKESCISQKDFKFYKDS